MARIHPVTHIRDIEKNIAGTASGRISKWLYLSKRILKKHSLAVLASLQSCRAIGFFTAWRLAAWTDLDKQGRFKELGIELTEARFSDSYSCECSLFFRAIAAARAAK